MITKNFATAPATTASATGEQFLSIIFRVFTGVLFIFSGLIKLNDPVGTQIKLEEYFEVFANDFGAFFHNFVPMALGLAVVLSVLEVSLGVALLIRFKMKETLWALLAMIVFFTFLTFYSAYFNKVTDCGCFGDAIKLTPWQSFGKDLVLLLMIGYMFIFRNKYTNLVSNKASWIFTGAATLFAIALSTYAIRHLPPINFRPYKIGASIPTLMQPSAPFQYQYILTKDGKEHTFTEYPSDPSYTYKDMILVNPEAMPKITDYRVWNDEGDFTEETFKGNKLLIVIQSLGKTASMKDYAPISTLIANAEAQGMEPILITSADKNAFEEFRHEAQLSAPYYFADATVLKTMIRSNPGIILMQNGVVKGRWHYNDTPTAEEVKALL
jgi:uncharacterized membrane protein YphA (DoxX/SURF4 family)